MEPVLDILTASTTMLIAFWISSIAVILPVEKRTVPMANSSGTPMASSTFDTATSPEWQAMNSG
ncbi:hypothetical protein ACFLU6_13060, partial [Acidobacteriota bacterium]